MGEEEEEVLLVTGGSGFVGQHVVRELQLHDETTSEIRILDVEPYTNRLGHEENKPVRTFLADITDLEACREAFRGVHTVIHAAALVSYAFPADEEKLRHVNVQGTANVVRLCLEEGVSRLVFVSTAEVATRSRFLCKMYPLIVGQNEMRARLVSREPRVAPYVLSKLESERLVLAADCRSHTRGGGRLRTLALRPTLLYGELEPRLLPAALRAAAWTCGALVSPTMHGGRQQFTYVGNAAWGAVLAKEALKVTRCAQAVGGEPVFLTDDTNVEHAFSLAQQIAGSRARYSWAFLPGWLSFPLASAVERAALLLGVTLPVQPTAVFAFLGGYVCFSRLRAALHLSYTPRYSQQQAVARTRDFVSKQTSAKSTPSLTCHEEID